MRFFRRIGALLYLTMALCYWPAFADGDLQTREYPIMAAYLYNFLQFTTWPPDALKDGLTICVLGRNPFGELLNPLRSKTAQGTKIIVRYYKAMEPGVSACNVLFISNSESDAQSLVSALKGAPALTMSNIEGFADTGGMVEFVREDTKIGMRINNKVAQKAGLAVSSKLLSLAHVVE